MMHRSLRTLLIYGVMAAASRLAVAAPPSTSPYVTDPQNLYVQDATAEGIGSLNMVLCVIGATDPGDNVNAGPYIALIDMDKCQGNKGSSSASAGAKNFANAVVDVTRASNTDPMIGKVWLSFAEEGKSTQVYAYLSATQSPATAPPYGAFRMDYIGEKDGAVGFNGYIDSTTPGVIKFLETEEQSSSGTTALAMSTTSTTSGSGTMFVPADGGGGSPVTFNFSYNPGYFHRSDGTNDECFDRSSAHASTAVSQYGTYNAIDGTRVDQAHPGFPVLATYQGTSYYGFANYWGINFQGLALPDGSPVSGLTVTDQRPGNTTGYALGKLGGKLTKWTQVSTTLDALDGIPIMYGADLTGLTTGNPAVTGMNNWMLQWNSADGNFTVVGFQNCGNNGCVTSTLAPATVSSSAFNTVPISGWANSYGGSVNIPSTGSPHAAGDAVFYYTQTTVVPGTTALTLHCLNQCPTVAQLAGYSSSTLSTPYANGTDSQWFSAPNSTNTVTYTFAAGGLLDASSAPVVWENPPSDSQYAQNGIQTGWLVESALTNANCPVGGPDAQAGHLCQPANPTTYYTWQTGPNQWNQSLWLTSGGNVVPFDPPQNIAYTVPTGSAYGSYAGLPILLQFNGFGNLQGIPGSCVNPADNSAEDCTVSGASYVPTFSIPDGTTMTLTSLSGGTTTPLIVKALNGQILLKSLGSGAAQCSAMTLTPLALPSGGLHDPRNANDTAYLGAKPVVTAATKVIDGVVQ